VSPQRNQTRKLTKMTGSWTVDIVDLLLVALLLLVLWHSLRFIVAIIILFLLFGGRK
jgi:tellurite resistance protein TehA-like permease